MHQSLAESSSKNLQVLVSSLQKEIDQIGADKDKQIKAV